MSSTIDVITYQVQRPRKLNSRFTKLRTVAENLHKSVQPIIILSYSSEILREEKEICKDLCAQKQSIVTKKNKKKKKLKRRITRNMQQKICPSAENEAGISTKNFLNDYGKEKPLYF